MFKWIHLSMHYVAISLFSAHSRPTHCMTTESQLCRTLRAAGGVLQLLEITLQTWSAWALEPRLRSWAPAVDRLGGAGEALPHLRPHGASATGLAAGGRLVLVQIPVHILADAGNWNLTPKPEATSGQVLNCALNLGRSIVVRPPVGLRRQFGFLLFDLGGLERWTRTVLAPMRRPASPRRWAFL